MPVKAESSSTRSRPERAHVCENLADSPSHVIQRAPAAMTGQNEPVGEWRGWRVAPEVVACP